MSPASIFLGVLSLMSLSHGLPVTNEIVTTSLFTTGDSPHVQTEDVATTAVSYTLYTGSGQQWPTIDQWPSYEQMYDTFLNSASCLLTLH